MHSESETEDKNEYSEIEGRLREAVGKKFLISVNEIRHTIRNIRYWGSPLDKTHENCVPREK